MGVAEELLRGAELKRKEDDEAAAPAVNTGGAFKFDDETGEITPLGAGEDSSGFAKFTGGVKGLLSKGGSWIDQNPEKFSQLALGLGGALAKPDVRYDFNGRPYESTSSAQRMMGAASNMVSKFQTGPKVAAGLGADEAGLDTTGMSPEEIAGMMDSRSTIMSREATAGAQGKQGDAALMTAEARKTEAAEASKRTDIMAADNANDLKKHMDVIGLSYAQLTAQEKMHKDELDVQKIFHKGKMDLGYAQQTMTETLARMDDQTSRDLQTQYETHQKTMGDKMATLDFIHNVHLAKVHAEHENYDSYLSAVKNANASMTELGLEYARIAAVDPDSPALPHIAGLINQTVGMYGGGKVKTESKYGFKGSFPFVEERVNIVPQTKKDGSEITVTGAASVPPLPRSLNTVLSEVEDAKFLATMNNDPEAMNQPIGTFTKGNRFVKGVNGIFRKALPGEIASGVMFDEGNR